MLYRFFCFLTLYLEAFDERPVAQKLVQGNRQECSLFTMEHPETPEGHLEFSQLPNLLQDRSEHRIGNRGVKRVPGKTVKMGGGP